MTQEGKQLLFKDLCARLPYGVKINIRNDYTLTMEDIELNPYHLTTASYDIEYRGLRPYLRLMSSMTKEEKEEYNELLYGICDFTQDTSSLKPVIELTIFFYSNHLDYWGLIEKGLALEAPEGMYYG